MAINILVTNDDGVHSYGLKALVSVMSKIGNVYVAAPVTEKSTTGHALTLHRPLRAKKIGRGQIYAVNGTPTDCVKLALNGLFKIRPDIVVSGINMGPNLGDDITYSGTVAAAIEATLQNVPAIAISVSCKSRAHFKPAQEIALKLIKHIIKHPLPSNILLNVNVPNISEKKIKGYKFTRQGKRRYGDSIVEKVDPRGEKYYWIAGDILGDEPINNSDIQAVLEHYISITPIKLDLTAYDFLKVLSKWRLH